jgi:hypothetical protein
LVLLYPNLNAYQSAKWPTLRNQPLGLLRPAR